MSSLSWNQQIAPCHLDRTPPLEVDPTPPLKDQLGVEHQHMKCLAKMLSLLIVARMALKLVNSQPRKPQKLPMISEMMSSQAAAAPPLSNLR